MIKPEQIPDEVVTVAAERLQDVRGAVREAIAAAINAWPGVSIFGDVSGWDVHIELPLTQEKNDD